ncbi:MAG: hypothetical protein WBC44_14335 [Planctomycetaceae bacterium]
MLVRDQEQLELVTRDESLVEAEEKALHDLLQDAVEASYYYSWTLHED